MGSYPCSGSAGSDHSSTPKNTNTEQICGFKAPRHRDVSNKSELKGGKCKWLMYFRHLCFHNSFYHDLKCVTNNDKFYILNGALSPKQERDPEGNFSLRFNKLPQLVWRMRKRKQGGSVAGQVSKTQTCTELIRGELQYFSPWTSPMLLCLHDQQDNRVWHWYSIGWDETANNHRLYVIVWG